MVDGPTCASLQAKEAGWRQQEAGWRQQEAGWRQQLAAQQVACATRVEAAESKVSCTNQRGACDALLSCVAVVGSRTGIELDHSPAMCKSSACSKWSSRQPGTWCYALHCSTRLHCARASLCTAPLFVTVLAITFSSLPMVHGTVYLTHCGEVCSLLWCCALLATVLSPVCLPHPVQLELLQGLTVP